MSSVVNLGQLQDETPRNNLQLASFWSMKIKKKFPRVYNFYGITYH